MRRRTTRTSRYDVNLFILIVLLIFFIYNPSFFYIYVLFGVGFLLEKLTKKKRRKNRTWWDVYRSIDGRKKDIKTGKALPRKYKYNKLY